MKKEEALVELYNLIDFYYENRDLPVPRDFDFYEEINKCCDVLEVNKDVIIEKFKLHTM